MASASYSITLRVITDPKDQMAIGRVTTAIGEAEGNVVAFDFVESDERAGRWLMSPCTPRTQIMRSP